MDLINSKFLMSVLNEFNKFKEMGGVAVAVDADVEVRSKRAGYDPEYENDPTEEPWLT